MFLCRIKTNGDMISLYDDNSRGLLNHGSAEIVRASHVEPKGVKWVADMSPVNGPELGPFETRQEALDKEVEWLAENLFGVTSHDTR